MFREKIQEIDWETFLRLKTLILLNDMFEQKVGEVLGKLAPMKKIQFRQKYANWLDPEAKPKNEGQRLNERSGQNH